MLFKFDAVFGYHCMKSVGNDANNDACVGNLISQGFFILEIQLFGSTSRMIIDDLCSLANYYIGNFNLKLWLIEKISD